MNILQEIVQYKKKEVAYSKLTVPVCELEQMIHFERETFKLVDFLKKPDKTGIIAEFKRKSPSKGIINNKSSVEEVTSAYTTFGASALSILTDFNFFGGSVDDLLKARKDSQIPILRKDFIVDEYQIFEAKAIGADAILLIAAVLNKQQALTLAAKAHNLGLQVIMEFYNEDELDMLNKDIDIIGINNRDLKTFEVNLEHSVLLAEKIPNGFLKISESGISTPEDILYLKQHGFKGFLIGETFMKTSDPGKAYSSFVELMKKTELK
jgi:indole-3-glycerol phosphate synthase